VLDTEARVAYMERLRAIVHTRAPTGDPASPRRHPGGGRGSGKPEEERLARSGVKREPCPLPLSGRVPLLMHDAGRLVAGAGTATRWLRRS
jgi:hypothetical protein